MVRAAPPRRDPRDAGAAVPRRRLPVELGLRARLARYPVGAVAAGAAPQALAPPVGRDAMSTVALSLVVLSFRHFETTTGPCLVSLDIARDDPRLQIVLVDNGSDDGSAARCAEWAATRPELLYLPQATNLGFGGGMNAGVGAARGEWVCLVNSDTIFPSGAVQALITTLAALPAQVAMVGPVTHEAGNGQLLPL